GWGRTVELGRGEGRRPHFRGDERLIAFDGGGAQPLPHLAFVVVKLGGVDVAVAALERPLDDPRAGPPAQLPGAEADERDAGAVRFDGGGCNRPHHSPPLRIPGSLPASI